MKALTLKHPWPWAILHGKDIENRTWQPHPGELWPGQWFAIHAGKVPTGRAAREDVADEVEDLVELHGLPMPARLDEVLVGGIVAVARFGGAVRESESPWFEGPVGWLLTEVIALPTPIVVPGAQGLWAVPRGSRAFLERQVADLGRVLA